MEFNKKAGKRLLITIGIGIVLVVAFYIITGAITKYTGFSISEDEKYKDFEECLKKQDIKLYINSEDTNQELKETGLLDYLQYSKIHNCVLNNQPCIDDGINYFPTWNINNKVIVGEISLDQLAEYSGCKPIN